MTALGLEPAKSLSGPVIRQVQGIKHSFSYTSCYCEENVHLLVPALVRSGLAPSIDHLFAVFVSNPLKKMPMWQQRAGARHGRSGSHDNSDGGKTAKQLSDVCGVDGSDGGEQARDGDGNSDEGNSGAEEACSRGGDGGGSSDDKEEEDGGDGDDEGFVVWDYHVLLLQARHPTVPPASAAAAAPAERGTAAPTVAPASAAGSCPDGGGGSESRSGSGSGTLVWDLDTLLPFPCSLELFARRALKSQLQLTPPYQRFFRVVPAASYLRHFASDRSHMRRPGGGWSAEPPQYAPLVAADGTTNNIQRYWDMTTDRRSIAATEAATEAAAAVTAADGEGCGVVGSSSPSRAAAAAVAPGSVATTCAAGPVLARLLVSSGPYGVVLDEPSFLRAFGVEAG